MNTRDPNNALIDALRSRFPEESALTDRLLHDAGWDVTSDDIAFIWVEAFADRTAEAVRRRDGEAVRAHTGFLAEAYRAQPGALRTIIDVSYAENILGSVPAEDKVWAWKYIAADIRQLYQAMWGAPAPERR
jgi:hypothetical protein